MRKLFISCRVPAAVAENASFRFAEALKGLTVDAERMALPTGEVQFCFNVRGVDASDEDVARAFAQIEDMKSIPSLKGMSVSTDVYQAADELLDAVLDSIFEVKQSSQVDIEQVSQP